MSVLDSDALISTALKKLGNETITDNAEVWLGTILDRLYEDYQWPFLEKIATGVLTAGQSSVSLPADFDSPWDEDSFVIINSSGGRRALSFFTQYDQDMLASQSTLGTPSTAVLDLNAMTWRPYPLPDTGYTYQIRYRYQPGENEAVYANFTPVFPNDAIIIQALYVEGLNFEDDDRYVAQLALLDKMIKTYKGKFNRQAQKKSQMRFSSRFATPGSYR